MKKYLSSYYKIKEEILEEYISHWSEYTVPRKSVITECGRTERYLYFAKDGIQK